MRKMIFFLLLFQAAFGAAQTRTLVIEPTFGKTALQLNTYYRLSKNDSLQITNLKFYISNLQFFNDGALVWVEPNAFYLIDAADSTRLKRSLKIPNHLTFNALQFDLGIDSITNVAGALGGDLDATKGMYWAWQSGYVNFKLEGRSNLCPTRKNAFQFHLGGYLTPHNALQTLYLKGISPNNLTLLFDLQPLFENLDLKTQNSIMIPSEETVLLAQKVAKSFKRMMNDK
ncbi:MAG: hypothetical protein RLZZ628_4080 [Bacteroidota bacterium]|jgi:hypothetical protein